MTTEIVAKQRGLQLENFEQMLAFAKAMVDAGVVPDKNPGAVLAKIQQGAELGLAPMQAINTMYVIDGKVAMEVKSMRAIVESTYDRNGEKLCKVLEVWLDEEATIPGTNSEGHETLLRNPTAYCKVERPGRKEVTFEYSWNDAKVAGLLERWPDTGILKKKNWRNHGKTMLRWRAMGRAFKEYFADILLGIMSVEETEELEPPKEAIDIDISTSEAAKRMEETDAKAVKFADHVRRQWSAGEPAAVVNPGEEDETIVTAVTEVDVDQKKIVMNTFTVPRGEPASMLEAFPPAPLDPMEVATQPLRDRADADHQAHLEAADANLTPEQHEGIQQVAENHRQAMEIAAAKSAGLVGLPSEQDDIVDAFPVEPVKKRRAPAKKSPLEPDGGPPVVKPIDPAVSERICLENILSVANCEVMEELLELKKTVDLNLMNSGDRNAYMRRWNKMKATLQNVAKEG